MMKNKMKLFKAVGYTDDKYVSDALSDGDKTDADAPSAPRRILSVAAIAAVFVMLFAFSFVLTRLASPRGGMSGSSDDTPELTRVAGDNRVDIGDELSDDNTGLAADTTASYPEDDTVRYVETTRPEASDYTYADLLQVYPYRNILPRSLPAGFTVRSITVEPYDKELAKVTGVTVELFYEADGASDDEYLIIKAERVGYQFKDDHKYFTPRVLSNGIQWKAEEHGDLLKLVKYYDTDFVYDGYRVSFRYKVPGDARNTPKEPGDGAIDRLSYEGNAFLIVEGAQHLSDDGLYAAVTSAACFEDVDITEDPDEPGAVINGANSGFKIDMYISDGEFSVDRQLNVTLTLENRTDKPIVLYRPDYQDGLHEDLNLRVFKNDDPDIGPYDIDMLGHGFSEAISYNTVMPGETYSQPMRLSFAPYLFDPRCTRESLCGQYTFEVVANIVDDDVPKGIKSVRFAFSAEIR